MIDVAVLDKDLTDLIQGKAASPAAILLGGAFFSLISILNSSKSDLEKLTLALYFSDFATKLSVAFHQIAQKTPGYNEQVETIKKIEVPDA